MDFKATFVASLLLVCYVGQAYSSIACYVCEHPNMRNDTDCRDKPEQVKHIKYCGISSYPFKDVPEVNKAADETISFKCATVEAKNSSTSVLKRACVPSFLTCDLIKTMDSLQLKDGTLETCRICDGDICNSSSRVDIAIFTLIPCLIAYFIFK